MQLIPLLSLFLYQYFPLCNLCHRVQSAQQFQALQTHQAQYSGYDHNQQSHYPEGPNGEAAMAHMAYPEPMTEEQEPENIAKRTMISLNIVDRSAALGSELLVFQ